EEFARGGFVHAALAAADALLKHVLERVARNVGSFRQPLGAARLIGDDHGGTARRTFGVQAGKNIEFHISPAAISERPTPPSPHTPESCRRTRARPSRRSRRRRRIRESWACRFRSRRALR